MTRLPDVSPDEAADLAAQGAVLVDVRTDAEWSQGHAPDAVHVPLDRLTAEDISADQQVLTICHTGGRSAIAADRIAQTHQVRNVAGGMAAWENQGMPVADGKSTG